MIPVPSANTVYLSMEMLTDEQYAEIRSRGVTNALPSKILDNGGYPNREIYVYPIPTEEKVVELWLWEPLQIVDLDAQIDLPQGYERYLIYALAMELTDTFGKAPTPEIEYNLKDAEDHLKSLNQIVFTSQPTESAKVLSRGGQPYDILSFQAGAIMLPRRVV